MTSHRSLSQEEIQQREATIRQVVGAFQAHPVWVWEAMLLCVPPEVWEQLIPHVRWVTWKVDGDLVGPPDPVKGPMSLHADATEPTASMQS